VVQSSAPAVCASTKKKSHCGSVSRVTWKLRFAPPAGTSMVCVSRLYDGSPAWVNASREPVRGDAGGADSFGSRASQYAIPAFLYFFTRYSPTVAVARYGAIGSRACQVVVVQPCRVLLPTSTPFDKDSRPCGAVIRVVKDALSSGWSLTGNQVEATSGCPTMTMPSSVAKTPDEPRFGSAMTWGTPS
jgi:hypothetical protein